MKMWLIKTFKASTNQTLTLTIKSVQRKEVPFGGGFDLVAELKPDISSLKRHCTGKFKSDCCGYANNKELLNSGLLYIMHPDNMIQHIIV